VLRSHTSDQEASKILAAISEAEDLNGRTRRSVLDTRRALSFLLRGKFLSETQHNDVREILRDIESLDGHTAFLFNKINFLMDATDSAININQNKDIKRLTVLSVIFMPINVLAGMGGMSEFSMMTEGIPWPIAYAGFVVAMVVVGTLTYFGLRSFRNAPRPRQPRSRPAQRLKIGRRPSRRCSPATCFRHTHPNRDRGYQALKTASAAATVAAISASLWAAETKPASKADGAK
jgi:hypothetical protein